MQSGREEIQFEMGVGMQEGSFGIGRLLSCESAIRRDWKDEMDGRMQISHRSTHRAAFCSSCPCE